MPRPSYKDCSTAVASDDVDIWAGSNQFHPEYCMSIDGFFWRTLGMQVVHKMIALEAQDEYVRDAF